MVCYYIFTLFLNKCNLCAYSLKLRASTTLYILSAELGKSITQSSNLNKVAWSLAS